MIYNQWESLFNQLAALPSLPHYHITYANLGITLHASSSFLFLLTLLAKKLDHMLFAVLGHDEWSFAPRASFLTFFDCTVVARLRGQQAPASEDILMP